MNIKKPALSLRDLKFAKTRANILNTFLKLVKMKDYEEISVDELCEKAEVSRSTFFNYFPSKEHLFTYYGWCFCAEIFVQLKEMENKNVSCLEKIKYIFNLTIEEDNQHEHQFSLFVSHIVRRHIDIIKEMQYTRADFLYKYPDKENYIDNSKIIQIPTIGGFFLRLLEEGVSKGEFKSDTDIKRVMLHLLSIYFSPPIVCKFTNYECDLEHIYGLLLDDILNPIN